MRTSLTVLSPENIKSNQLVNVLAGFVGDQSADSADSVRANLTQRYVASLRSEQTFSITNCSSMS